jgi:hypothetical protein
VIRPRGFHGNAGESPGVHLTSEFRCVYAVIGRVEIHEAEMLAMIQLAGVKMVCGMAGSAGRYWARSLVGDRIQQSFWLVETEEQARSAEAIFNSLRPMADAPATFMSVDVCEVVGQA